MVWRHPWDGHGDHGHGDHHEVVSLNLLKIMTRKWIVSVLFSASYVEINRNVKKT
ncbi:unnamed protein product [Brassica napus]|uniref:(rape) hypothetical protein n=1 Tax=Brassica napus TaxID=3708 RepID=A0A816TCJ4_BRANA|nr:unnamed protein product [Brassica napus]